MRLHNRSVLTKISRLRALERHLGERPIEEIRPAVARAYMAARKKEGVSHATVNRELTVLRHLLAWACEEEWIERNPLARLKRLPETVSERRPSEKEIDRVLAELDPRVRPLFLFIRETGCRREEALSLRWFQVDLERRRVLFTDNTKSGRYRYVGLTRALVETLGPLPRSPTSDHVFFNPRTGTRWSDCRKPWLAARGRAGSGLRVKDLRKAFGIKLAEAGCEMHFISRVLGHSSVAITEKYYAQFSPESAVERVLEVLERGAGGQKEP